MKFFLISLILSLGACEHNFKEQCPNVKTSIGSVRKRRYLMFPDGSNAAITLSLAKYLMTNVPSGWAVVMDLDVTFPLPDTKFYNEHRRRKHHRQKRDMWKQFEDAISFHNLDGHACVLRSICENQKYLAPPGKSLVHDLLRAIFKVPIYEEDFVDTISDSYREVLEPDFCDRVPDCPLSILHFVLALNKPHYY